MSTAHVNVIDGVVEQHLCIGCGLCAVMCPRRRLTVAWNDRGELVAGEVEPGSKCGESCRVCLRVCPFGDDLPDEDGLAEQLFPLQTGVSADPRIGRYRELFVARVADEGALARSASGGIGTWFLKKLLAQGLVDGVVCVTPRPNPLGEELFGYTLCTTAEQVDEGASSAYYPVTLSEVLANVVDEGRRVAVVGLPCFIKGIRRAQAVDRRIREFVPVCVGLVCGQTKSRFFTEYLSHMSCGQNRHIESVRFREKSDTGDAADFSCRFVWSDGTSSALSWSEGIGRPWGMRLFTPRACGFCDDVFSETADISLMDAWHKPWISDPRGTSYVIVRSNLARLIIDSCMPDLGTFGPIKLEDVVASQAWRLRDKREGLVYRIRLGSEGRLRIPRKRDFGIPIMTVGERLRWRAAYRVSERSPELWASHRSVQGIRRELLYYQVMNATGEVLGSLKSLPSVMKRLTRTALKGARSG